MIAYDSPGADYGAKGPTILQALAVAVEHGATHVGTAGGLRSVDEFGWTDEEGKPLWFYRLADTRSSDGRIGEIVDGQALASAMPASVFPVYRLDEPFGVDS